MRTNLDLTSSKSVLFGPNSGDNFSSASGRIKSPRQFDLTLKRVFDIFSSLFALVLLAPVLAIIMICVFAEDPGSPFFSQIRWGKDGKKIRIYKFRSMHKDLCDSTGVNQTIAGDPRITNVGRILRKTNLDELPQLWNVLKGDMSIVGPRCHAIGMLAGGMLYEELVPQYHDRHTMRPGLTGLAQMRGLRGPTDRPARARARIVSDIYYIKHFSFLMDIKIVFGTIMSELSNSKGF